MEQERRFDKLRRARPGTVWKVGRTLALNHSDDKISPKLSGENTGLVRGQGQGGGTGATMAGDCGSLTTVVAVAVARSQIRMLKAKPTGFAWTRGEGESRREESGMTVHVLV